MGLGIAAVEAAAERIRPWVHRTPVLTSASLDEVVGTTLYFKCENLQKTGAFKARGAVNAVAQSDADVVVTHSSGNHGAALAYAAQTLGKRAIVVVPEDASPIKVANITRYGAQIVRSGPTLESREAVLGEVLAGSGGDVVPPYDDACVVLGQGTAALEFMRDVGHLDSLWLPVGGGGLAAGAVVAVGDAVRVVGAEPALAGDAAAGLAAGVRQPQMPPHTVADGLRTSLGALNFEVLHGYGLHVELVDEDEIIEAQQLMMSCLKVLVEPSSAVAFAALRKARPSGDVGMIVTGGNVAV